MSKSDKPSPRRPPTHESHPRVSVSSYLRHGSPGFQSTRQSFASGGLFSDVSIVNLSKSRPNRADTTRSISWDTTHCVSRHPVPWHRVYRPDDRLGVLKMAMLSCARPRKCFPCIEITGAVAARHRLTRLLARVLMLSSPMSEKRVGRSRCLKCRIGASRAPICVPTLGSGSRIFLSRLREGGTQRSRGRFRGSS